MTERPLRADAKRNRERVLAVAAEVFAAEGLGVPVHEIARRAGVGTGTVSRHFPTKEELYAAVLVERMADLTRRADGLVGTDPGTAFGSFFAAIIREGATHLGLAEALAGAGYDVEKAGAAAGYDISGRLRDLLARAQAAGAVRADVDNADVKALMSGCLARAGDPVALERVIDVVLTGLRERARESPPGPS